MPIPTFNEFLNESGGPLAGKSFAFLGTPTSAIWRGGAKSKIISAGGTITKNAMCADYVIYGDNVKPPTDVQGKVIYEGDFLHLTKNITSDSLAQFDSLAE